MPRRSILSATERDSLLALPDTKDDLIRHYSLSDSDLSIIRQRRGPANRLGFAVQLCYLRFPGIVLGVDQPPFPPLLKLVADQLKVGVESWNDYGQRREQTRREHLVELQTVFGFQPFTMSHYRQAVHTLTGLAMQTDKGIVLADALIEHLRQQSIILPALNAIERASAEAIIDEAAQAQAELMDGKLLLVTNVPDQAPVELVKRYKSLADIERGFRVLKSEIEIAPVHHRLPQRIRAHAFVCFIALIVYRVMRQRLKLAKSDLSPEKALAQLRRIQRHSVSINASPPIAGISTVNDLQSKVFAALKTKKPTQDTQMSLL